MDKSKSRHFRNFQIGIFKILFCLQNETFKNFSEAEDNFARLRLQGLQKGLASEGASRLFTAFTSLGQNQSNF